MKTFHLEVACDVKAVIPDDWVKLIRSEAQADDATPFLKEAQRMHPDDDDEFILMVLKKGVRTQVQDGLRDLFAASALGCTISPPRTTYKFRSPPPPDAVPVLPDQV